MGSEDEAQKALVEAATAAATALATEGYKDLAQPAARELGAIAQTGASLLRLVMRPLTTLVDSGHALWDRLDHRLHQRLLAEPHDKVVEPPAHIAGPLLLGYPFVEQQEELRTLFEELLAKAMLVDSKPKVHPAFVEVLKQLSSDEARLLPLLAGTHLHPALRVAYTHEPHLPPLPRNTVPFGARPTVTLEEAHDAAELHRNRSWIGEVNITAFADQVPLEQPQAEAVERGIVNLQRLGLLRIEAITLRSAARADPYAAVRQSTALKELETWAAAKTLYLDLQNAAIVLTAFGRQFLEMCLPPGSTHWDEAE